MPIQKKLVRVHTRLESSHVKKIARIARKEKLSQAEVLRGIVDYYFMYQGGF